MASSQIVKARLVALASADARPQIDSRRPSQLASLHFLSQSHSFSNVQLHPFCPFPS